MSERQTKRQSGAYYRKKRELKIKETNELSGALTKFLDSSKNLSVACTSASSTSDIVPEEREPSLEIPDLLIASSPSRVKEQEQQQDDTLSSRSSESEKENPEEEDIDEAEPLSSSLELADIGTWPDSIDNQLLEILVKKGPVQRRDNFSFPSDETNRKFSTTYYDRILENGEKVPRNWLVYSSKLNKVFCFCCKLFSKNIIKLTRGGYSDWRHAAIYFGQHEKSAQHIECSKMWCELKFRMQKNCTIDKHLQTYYERETKRWRAIIERMIAVVQFLCGQCLAFRGESTKLYKPNNGNFMKAVEMLAKFDPIIAEHVKNVQTSKQLKTHMPYYFGVHFQNEIIELLAAAIREKLTTTIKDSKYFSVILDCTPDVSHVEQITFVVRIVNCTKNNVKIEEYFLGFFPIVDTTGEGLFNYLTNELLPKFSLDVQNIRGQGYDNGANMRGKDIGLQKRILNVNPRATFVPCAAHCLNLVLNDAVSINNEIVGFFDIVQELFNFFSASPYRWNILKKNIKTFTLKPLSSTRWSSRINAIRPLQQNLKQIYDSLIVLSNDQSRDLNTRNMSNSLSKKLKSFKFLCSLIIWRDMLAKIDVVSKMLQNPNININESTKALDNLKKSLNGKRNDISFNEYISEATKLAGVMDVEPEFPQTRKRKKSRKFLYESSDESVQNPEQNFKVNFYFPIIDTAKTSVEERFILSDQCNSIFSFLCSFLQIDSDILKKCCMDLEIFLQKKVDDVVEKDLNGLELFNEILNYREIFPTSTKPLITLDYIINNELVSSFPNFSIALRIFLTLPVTVASGERSFSKLKLIKNYLRSSMSQERLTSLALLSIEKDICESLDLSKVIDEFASKKARRVHL